MNELAETSIVAICDTCGKIGKSKPAKSGEPKLPNKWKRISGKLHCVKCVNKNFRIVALTLPIDRIISVDGRDAIKEDWRRLWDAMRPLWRDCGMAMSWSLLRLYATDAEMHENMRHHEPGEKPSLGKLPETSLYKAKAEQDEQGLRERWPNISSTTASIIAKRAKEKYKDVRWEIFTGQSQLPLYGNQPYPIRADAYSIAKAESGKIVVRVTLGKAKTEWVLALGNRERFWRPLETIVGVLSGNGAFGEAAISEKKMGRDGRPDIAVKIICRIPKPAEERPASGTLLIRTDDSSFLRARIMGRQHDECWFNEDQVRRWIGEHSRRLRRLGDDEKSERRAGNEPSLQHHRDELTRKQHHDDSFGSFVERFPWFQFWTRLESQLGARHIQLVNAKEKEKQMEKAKNMEGWISMFNEIQKIGKEKTDDQ